MWTQPFFYEQIAHIIIPRVFTFDKLVDNIRETWEAEQDVDRISTLLSAQGIQHNISQYAVDLKLF